MKHLAAFGLALLATAAHAQSGTNVPPGQFPANTAMNQAYFSANTDPIGYGETGLNPALVAAGTTQATAALITARTTVITACATGAGVQLPAVQRFQTVVVLNRSGVACLVYPPLNAAIEAGAVNASVSVASGADVLFRPASATQWYQ